MHESVAVGAARVTALLDSEGPFFVPRSEAFPGVDDQALEQSLALDPDPHTVVDDVWWLAFRVYVVEAAGRVLLVDAGAASETSLHSPWAPEGPHLAERLREELGITPDRVDDVVLTHLHGDHVAGSVDTDGLAAFPAATYHAQARELDALRETGPDSSTWRNLVVPLTSADQLHACEGTTGILSGGGVTVRVEPTPGHTPGHQSVVVSGGAEHLLVAGDAFVHAVQLVAPATRYIFDDDHDEAVRSRTVLLEQARQLGARLGTAHLRRAFVEPPS